jgi:hypothetical protein
LSKERESPREASLLGIERCFMREDQPRPLPFHA